MNTKERINEVKGKIDALKQQINDLYLEEKALAVEIFCDETGFNLGDKIVFGKSRGIISGFEYVYGDIYPLITPINKDGNTSKVVRRIYPWDLKDLKKS